MPNHFVVTRYLHDSPSLSLTEGHALGIMSIKKDTYTNNVLNLVLNWVFTAKRFRNCMSLQRNRILKNKMKSSQNLSMAF